MTENARRILFVHAHPDDETIASGATMAKCADSGAHVALVTCTLGEEGEVLVPELGHLAASEQDEWVPSSKRKCPRRLSSSAVSDHEYLGGRRKVPRLPE